MYICGIRHVMVSMRIYYHLIFKGMLSSEYCWAFHSDCTEELLAMLPGMKRNEPTWEELRCHGAGWWIRSNDVLKRVAEKVRSTTDSPFRMHRILAIYRIC